MSGNILKLYPIFWDPFDPHITEWHFHSTSIEGICPQKISSFMQGLKSAILAFF